MDNNSDMPLTHDEHKEASSDMLNDTKDLTQNTVKIIGEGIQNENKNLETILFTLVWLSTFGYSYFKGNFADRGRYESLICPFTVFFDMIFCKVKELDFPKVTDRLLISKDKIIEYLREDNWTIKHMTGHQWVTNK